MLMEEVLLGLVPIKGEHGFSEDIKKIQLLIKSEKLLHPVPEPLWSVWSQSISGSALPTGRQA
jgi:hypothetical protein